MIDQSQNTIIYLPKETPCLVVAPPGYGKTETMARRIQYLYRNKLIKGNKKILGLTFTNAAAFEMRKKIIANIVGSIDNIVITTFHSFCYKILLSYGYKVGISSNFEIISDLKKEQIIKSMLIGLCHSDAEYKEFCDWIVDNHLKQQERTNDFMNELWNRYKSLMIEENKLDFDIILLKTYELLLSQQSILEFYRNRLDYILVDEFQDTNILQYKIIKLLIEGKEPETLNNEWIPFICFGDKHQSIYHFQGSCIEIFDTLIRDFNQRGLIEKELMVNHRTGSNLLKEINKALRDNVTNSENMNIEPIPLIIYPSKDDEAENIVQSIKSLYESGCPLHEICVISPQYNRIGTIYERLEIENINNIYLKHYRNKEILKRFQPLFQQISEKISQKQKKGNILLFIKKICNENNIPLNDIIGKRILEYVKDFERFSDYRSSTFWRKLLILKNDLMLEIKWGELMRKKIPNKVYISSIHQVKGLEFEHVYLVGLESGLIPFYLICKNKCPNNISDQELQEDKNLIYVAISRLKDSVVITSIKYDNTYPKKLSCVLGDYKQFIEVLDIKTMDKGSIDRHLCLQYRRYFT